MIHQPTKNLQQNTTDLVESDLRSTLPIQQQGTNALGMLITGLVGLGLSMLTSKPPVSTDLRWAQHMHFVDGHEEPVILQLVDVNDKYTFSLAAPWLKNGPCIISLEPIDAFSFDQVKKPALRCVVKEEASAYWLMQYHDVNWNGIYDSVVIGLGTVTGKDMLNESQVDLGNFIIYWLYNCLSPEHRNSIPLHRSGKTTHERYVAPQAEW